LLVIATDSKFLIVITFVVVNFPGLLFKLSDSIEFKQVVKPFLDSDRTIKHIKLGIKKENWNFFKD